MPIETLIMYADVFTSKGFHRIFDEYITKSVKYEKDGISWTFDPFADFNIYIHESYKIPMLKRLQLYAESMNALGLETKKVYH